MVSCQKIWHHGTRGKKDSSERIPSLHFWYLMIFLLALTLQKLLETVIASSTLLRSTWLEMKTWVLHYVFWLLRNYTFMQISMQIIPGRKLLLDNAVKPIWSGHPMGKVTWPLNENICDLVVSFEACDQAFFVWRKGQEVQKTPDTLTTRFHRRAFVVVCSMSCYKYKAITGAGWKSDVHD